VLKWMKAASEKAQRRNVERTLTRLIALANQADGVLRDGGDLSPGAQRAVVSVQKQLLGDLVGMVPLDQLRREYLDPLASNPEVTEGTRMAVQHVFDTAAKG